MFLWKTLLPIYFNLGGKDKGEIGNLKLGCHKRLPMD
jgi:hypothetical protein